MITTAVVIPFRDRGRDPLRKANLGRVLEFWRAYAEEVVVCSDGRDGDAQFNRSAAYNRGARLTDADVIVFAESDILLPFEQVEQGVGIAADTGRMVVPFTRYHYLSELDSERVRAFEVDPAEVEPEHVIDFSVSSGAVNVVSRKCLNAVGGYDEAFEGNWYDDTAMRHAFAVTSGPPIFMLGAGYHLYHLPGWTGDHLTVEDRAATARNKARCERYQAASEPWQIRELTR